MFGNDRAVGINAKNVMDVVNNICSEDNQRVNGAMCFRSNFMDEETESCDMDVTSEIATMENLNLSRNHNSSTMESGSSKELIIDASGNLFKSSYKRLDNIVDVIR